MNLLTKQNTTPIETAPRRAIVPRYQVQENADAFVVTAYVPGVERSALETHVDGEHLTVFARRAEVPADWTSIYRESAPADYRLVLELDHRFNREAVRAELTQGVLKLTLPKAETVKPRRIEING